MISRMFKVSLALLFLVLLTACGATATQAPATAAPTATPTAASSGAAVAGLRTYVIVPAESKAVYLIDEEFFGGALKKLGIEAGKKAVVGETQAIEGQLSLNLDDLSAALGENAFTVKMNTFATDQPDRDKWIREDGPRFNQFPLASFKATALEGAPDAYSEGQEVSFKLSGDLTIRAISQPVTFDVTAKLAGDTLTGIASTRLLMSKFGIDPPNFANTLTVADEFGIEVHFTARTQ